MSQLLESVCSGFFFGWEPAKHTWFVEETPKLVFHVSLPFFQMLLLHPEKETHTVKAFFSSKIFPICITHLGYVDSLPYRYV